MDASIVANFQKLRVLASYDLKRMDELVQDLTNALEETSRSPRSKSSEHLSGTLKRNCYKKRRGRKRRTNSNCRYDGGNFSEASESSIEEGGVQSQELRENAATTTTHQSDSDDVVTSARLQGPFTKLSCVLSLAESDSVTENFSPLRPHRRRHRKFKRMSIDAQPLEDRDMACEASVTRLCSADTAKRPLYCNKPKLKTLEAKNDNVIDLQQLMEDTEDLPTGKRKRNGSSREGDRTGISTSSSSSSMQATSRMECMSQSQESSSSFSSSESECGIFTNDEARDGDDEQSDFFHEPGSACEVPGIAPWWENELTQEATFNSILTGSFQLLSSSAKAGFKSRVNKMGREIRSGRRRLKPGRVAYPPVRKQKPEITGLSMDKLTLWHGSNAAPSTGDVKRRRQTPPQSPSDQQPCHVGENADPIHEKNIGSHMLQNMSWTLGSGLGVDGRNLAQPNAAYRRTKRKGLGTCDES